MATRLIALLVLLINCTTVQAEPTRIAVASNFRVPLEKIIELYQQQHPEADIRYSSAASGSLYHQLVNGAPFDIFLSADSRYPSELERLNLIKPNSRRSYAQGELVLYSPEIKKPTLELLNNTTIALANPKLAPYGRAAEQVIKTLSPINIHKVYGQSLAQTYQFAISGNATAAFIARSLVHDQPNHFTQLSGLYHPIEQQSVLMIKADERAQKFYDFIFSADAQQLISEAGYRSPTSKLAINEVNLAAGI